ncbi:Na+/H+ antiporter NhaA [Cellulomonas flavigena DSM 20109]|uniref:Na(+)/H(+) antiporter NhaA n=1 Tax=Cellulomonas flavigena (strain ATCC 482 / DSM 20109 / BCRC 11376 / JCM 18109 / NBRC 3775 / NCIMB 8073 / NRS 134) TaxID=446466 RepID=D5UL92_CELFN|nr:Na+/H+ antiporter NhaA [Cellulomonas flavigena]ADG75974.1 Na+/H+ antiporter NhaA [Cellulomonas flavigena DSM 20109]
MTTPPATPPATPPDGGPQHRTLFSALSPGGERNLADTLRDERTGGMLLLAGALLALLWANLAPASYGAVSGTVVGPAALHLDLDVAHWASDFLLAIFFFVVGVELKREMVVGELRHVATAALPAAAAVGGMVVPAGVYLAVNTALPGGAPEGWAVPTATDIAFAVGVLAIVGRGVPVALRAFLLTLAVVDDLLAIVIIAVGYTDSVAVGLLAGSFACVAVFALALRHGVRTPVLLVPLALAAWALLHASGVHATIAGVLLGFAVPAAPGTALGRRARGDAPEPHEPGEDDHSLAEHYEHLWRPVSAGFAVPVFALFAAGVTVDASMIGATFAEPVGLGVLLGLVLGKPLGITAATWLVARFTRARLAPGLGWWDVVGVGLLAGIGFTVSLLVGVLAFGSGSVHDDQVVVAVLAASLLAAAGGGGVLAWRGRVHTRRGAPTPEVGTSR